MNCANCNKKICKTMIGLQDDCRKKWFHSVCIQCVNTCSECGEDIGMSKSSTMSENECTICYHQSCRSCGINLRCDKHEITVWENCIDADEEEEICICLKYKLLGLRKQMEKWYRCYNVMKNKTLRFN